MHALFHARSSDAAIRWVGRLRQRIAPRSNDGKNCMRKDERTNGLAPVSSYSFQRSREHYQQLLLITFRARRDTVLRILRFSLRESLLETSESTVRNACEAAMIHK